MTIDFYIRSRGYAVEQDYSWVHVTKENEKPAQDPPIVSHPDIDKLIYREGFSLLLGRYLDKEEQKLVLQVTGLSTEVSKRVDSASRRIRNTLACISDCSTPEEDEMTLRGIAIVALRGDLDKIVDNAVKDFRDSQSDKQGYKVVGQELIPRLMGLRDTVVKADDNGPILNEGCGKDIIKLREKIAQQLEQHALPRDLRPLVVVTRHTSEKVFKHYDVLWGLSDNIDKLLPDEHASIRDYNSTDDAGKEADHGGLSKGSSKLFLTAFLLLLLVGIIIWLYILWKFYR